MTRVECDDCGRVPNRGEEFRPCRWTTDVDDTTVPVAWFCPECDSDREERGKK